MAAMDHVASNGHGVSGNGAEGDGDGGEHVASELLEVERLTSALTAEWLEQYAVLPLKVADDAVIVGTWSDKVEPLALDDLRLTFGLPTPVKLEKFSEHDLRSAIRRVYAPEATTAEGLIAGLSGGESSCERR